MPWNIPKPEARNSSEATNATTEGKECHRLQGTEWLASTGAYFYKSHTQAPDEATAHIPVYLLPQQSESAGMLDILTDIAAALEIEDLSFTSYTSAIDHLQDDELSQKLSSLHLKQAERELRTHLVGAKHEEALIRKWLLTLQAQPGTGNTPETLERRKLAHSAKAKEYQKELAATTLIFDMKTKMPRDVVATVSVLAEWQKQLRSKDRELQTKRAKVQAYQGLPPNLELARHELMKARDEQTKLIQLRERLLSRMADGVN
ncbi:hypothetical protein CERSUDRAFT_70011 [Gelatoporia subvermispora B]|uniref:Uncharacterized protein n=1 Tax=Ceriporiopsis subvermispora (strain B) TaxID=914234 RepID=M2QWJ1_CERS8|nr:hypothetical protein CERSUDRAFT_70011 [Gelatoporia subvermispora B]